MQLCTFFLEVLHQRVSLRPKCERDHIGAKCRLKIASSLFDANNYPRSALWRTLSSLKTGRDVAMCGCQSEAPQQQLRRLVQGMWRRVRRSLWYSIIFYWYVAVYQRLHDNNPFESTSSQMQINNAYYIEYSVVSCASHAETILMFVSFTDAAQDAILFTGYCFYSIVYIMWCLTMFHIY